MQQNNDIELMVQCAKYIAMQAHGSQRYGQHPYSYHLEAVERNTIRNVTYSHTKLNYGTNLFTLRTIAWLHDIIEDTHITADILSQIFPSVVVDAVVALTKQSGQSYEDYIKQVRKNVFAQLVKMADTGANLDASLASGELRRINKYEKQLDLLNILIIPDDQLYLINPLERRKQ